MGVGTAVSSACGKPGLATWVLGGGLGLFDLEADLFVENGQGGLKGVFSLTIESIANFLARFEGLLLLEGLISNFKWFLLV